MVIEKDESGKFAKGNRGGPGRPKRDREELYQATFTSVVTPARWKKVIEKALTQAERGDPVARKWIADYIVGAPVQRNEHSGPDGDRIIVRLINDEG